MTSSRYMPKNSKLQIHLEGHYFTLIAIPSFIRLIVLSNLVMNEMSGTSYRLWTNSSSRNRLKESTLEKAVVLLRLRHLHTVDKRSFVQPH